MARNDAATMPPPEQEGAMVRMTVRNLVLVGVVFVGSLGYAPPATSQEPALVIQRSREFFPLGVYWPGEFVFRNEQKQYDWPRIEALLDSLAAHHCNTIWLTHTGAADAAEFARRAAPRGLYLVASLGELCGSVPHIRNTDYAKQRAAVLTAWGDAPPPIAWGLGDEPRTAYMRELGPFTKAWHEAGQPVTTVVMAGDLPAAGLALKQSFLCTDIYPFFSKRNPNGPDGTAESLLYLLEAGRRARYWAARHGIEWWFMGAIFQEPWGPHNFDDAGNIVYLPGAGPHFRYPTPAEVKWQTWAALAAGARGVIHFSLLFAPGQPGPDPAPLPKDKWLPFGVPEKWNSGAPGGILYADGRPTPQYDAMGEVFGEVAKLAPLLKQLEVVDDLTAFHAKGWVPPGDVAQVLRHAKTGALYVLVINGEVEDNVKKHVPLNVAPEVARVRDLRTGRAVPLFSSGLWEWEPVAPPYRQARPVLDPGDGTLLELVLWPQGPATVPTVSGLARPDLPVADLGGGRQQYTYAADFQKDQGAVDALEAAGYCAPPSPQQGQICGLAGAVVYVFDLPAGVVAVAGKAVFGNHADSADRQYAILYSTDGVAYQPLAAKTFGSGDGMVVSGQAAVAGGPRRLWLQVQMAGGNRFILVKQVEFKLTTEAVK